MKHQLYFSFTDNVVSRRIIIYKLLMEKDGGHGFKFKKSVGLNNPCKLLGKLFDFLISPILEMDVMSGMWSTT